MLALLLLEPCAPDDGKGNQNILQPKRRRKVRKIPAPLPKIETDVDIMGYIPEAIGEAEEPEEYDQEIMADGNDDGDAEDYGDED